MKKFVMNIFLAAGVVTLLLFSGCASGIINTSQSTTTDISQQKNAVTNNDAVITCYVGGIPHSQMISYASGTYLKELFSALASANARDPCSAETQHLQQQILLYAEQQGLLPAGTSADTIFEQLGKRNQNFASQNIGGVLPVTNAGTAREMFCNFVSTGEGSAFPIIILPRFIPLIMSPIPRLFVGWKTPLGVTSCGGLRSGTGFIASGEQQGLALGFWGIGFSIFLPPVMAYGMFGYALFAKVSAEEMEYWPPNSPPEITQTDPADGQQMVPLSTTQLRFSIDDENGDLMSYNVTTEPNIGSGNGGLKPEGIYSIPINGLESFTTYTWHIELTDGKETVEKTMVFTTEPVAPVISNPVPADDEREVPMDIPQLQFNLKDYQGDTMEYTVQTSPNIGSDHETGVHDGVYTVPISGLTYGATYRWYVNVTDGTHWTRRAFIFETGYPSQYDPFEFGWQYRKQITINHTYVTEDLTNFPVVLSTIDMDLAKAQVDGSDILFMDSPGVAKRLYHEIETFDRSTGTLACFVKLPELSSIQDTVLYLYYGNPNSINQEYPEKVWNSNFKAVWHLQESPSGTIHDSTTNHNDATAYGSMSSSDVVDGKVGKSIQFDGVNDYLFIPDSASLKPVEVTLLCWLNIASDYTNDEGREFILGKRCVDSYGNQDAVSYGMQYYNNYMGTRAEKNDNTQTLAKYNAELDNWYYTAMTFDSSTNQIRYYQNGILCDSVNHGQSLRYAGPLEFIMAAGHIHEGSTLNYWVNCKIDEVWIADTDLTPGWISTVFENQNNPADFSLIGPEEPHP
jgi:hypothetical protein